MEAIFILTIEDYLDRDIVLATTNVEKVAKAYVDARRVDDPMIEIYTEEEGWIATYQEIQKSPKKVEESIINILNKNEIKTKTKKKENKGDL
ncbi:hypothetical protein AAGG74_15375 [Bacillus mexicanus]|uniref:hypothetical protein n=1 Tax=Bacillus mexicanus TaxID=2834415 RepID=UPI003D25A736